MIDDDLTEDQVFYLFHTPASDRTTAAREVCEALAEANSRMLDRPDTAGAFVDSWFLAAPDLRHVDGNDLDTPEDGLLAADRLPAPGCHSILVGFNTVAPTATDSSMVAHRALTEVRNVGRFAPTEVTGALLGEDGHLVDAVIARAARLTGQEREDLASAGAAARARLGFESLIDYDRGLGGRIAPPGQELLVNRAWSRAVAAAGCPTEPNLTFAIGAAAGALAARSHLGQWPGWDAPEYFELTDPWRSTIAALHPFDCEDPPDTIAEVTVRTQRELNTAAADQLEDPDLTIIVDAPPDEPLRVTGTTVVTTVGATRLLADGHATVTARDETTITAHEHASIQAHDNATVHARFHAAITAHDTTTIHAEGGVTVDARDASQIHARGNCIVHVRDRVQVTATVDVEVVAHGDDVVMRIDDQQAGFTLEPTAPGPTAGRAAIPRAVRPGELGL